MGRGVNYSEKGIKQKHDDKVASKPIQVFDLESSEEEYDTTANQGENGDSIAEQNPNEK